MSSTTLQNKHPLLQKISYLSVLIALVLIFAFSASMKLSNHETAVYHFSKWSLLTWKNVIASAELVGALLILIPRLSIYGNIVLTALLGGAIFIHFQHTEPFYFPLAIILVIWINYLFIRPKK